MMRNMLWALAAGALAFVLGVLAFRLWINDAAFYRFDGVVGPAGQDQITAHAPARIADFEHGSPHRLAILVTDPASNWLGLARAFKAQGVPFTITENPERAFAHNVVLVYPIISGRALSQPALRAIVGHVHDGGTVLGFDLEGGGLESLFGVDSVSASRTRESLHWQSRRALPQEAVTVFSHAGADSALGSYAYRPAGAEVIARYEDGAAGILCSQRGRGRACLLGVDLGALANRAIDGRLDDVARAYVNNYEPSLDELVRWVAQLYVDGETMPWLIDTAPAGRDISIVLTHDIDYTRSVQNAAAYAAVERAAGVHATYFMQTKYVRDYNDDVFLTQATAPLLRALQDQGMEVASHSVAHSRDFSRFPLGDGRERYPDYRPFVHSRTLTGGGTQFGETRVSRFLLQRLVGAQVASFRPGHLSYPFQLPDVLAATGYTFSSSVTADSCLTHLPHQMSVGRSGASLSPIYEFPLTIEDEASPRLGDRYEAASAVLADIASHHGLAVILIHPDILGHKLAFERQLISHWRGRAWMPSLAEFGAWWRARDEAEFDIVEDPNGWAMMVRAPEELRDVAILLPKMRRLPMRGAGFQRTAQGLAISNISGDARLPLGR